MKPTTLSLGASVLGGAATLVALMGTGRLTLDTGWGRTTHPLGPLTWHVDAPRDLVWQQFTSHYLGRIPRDMRESLEIVERDENMVIARHLTDLGGFTSQTLEAVTFTEPERIGFRHLRGPVPHAVEEYRLVEDGDRTTLTYRGELGLDWWFAGSAAARYYAVPTWLKTVTEHTQTAIAAVEARAGARLRREKTT